MGNQVSNIFVPPMRALPHIVQQMEVARARVKRAE
ncbi:hypothetical protein U879_07135 [Defluviimonas sp. 20V17]|nr:hypothetical protein U879_07135 [Defluviimonas sp. 20V17]